MRFKRLIGLLTSCHSYDYYYYFLYYKHIKTKQKEC